MTGSRSHDTRPRAEERPVPLQVGHSGRARRGTLEVSLLLTTLFVVFCLMAFHDEIVQELVGDGWLPQGRSEFYELVFAGVLFVVWSLATFRLVRVVRNLGSPGGREE